MMERIFETLIMHKCNGKDLLFLILNLNLKNPNCANSNCPSRCLLVVKCVGKNGLQKQTLIRNTLIVKTLIVLSNCLIVHKCVGKAGLQRQTLIGQTLNVPSNA